MKFFEVKHSKDLIVAILKAFVPTKGGLGRYTLCQNQWPHKKVPTEIK
jgi:hypothetical protein